MTADGERELVRTIDTTLGLGQLDDVVARVLALRSPMLLPVVQIRAVGNLVALTAPLPLGLTWATSRARGAELSAAEAVDSVTRILVGLAAAHAAGLHHGSVGPGDVHLAPDGAVLAWCGVVDLEGTAGDAEQDVHDALALLDGFQDAWAPGVVSPAVLAARIRVAHLDAHSAAAELVHRFGRPFDVSISELFEERAERWTLDEPDVSFHDPAEEPGLLAGVGPRVRPAAEEPPVVPDELFEDEPVVEAPPAKRRGLLVTGAAGVVALGAVAAWALSSGGTSTPVAAAPSPLAATAIPTVGPLASISVSVAAPSPSPSPSPSVEASSVPVADGASLDPLVKPLFACGLDLATGASNRSFTAVTARGVTVYREDADYAPSVAAALVKALRGAPVQCPNPTVAAVPVATQWQVHPLPALTTSDTAAVELTRLKPLGLPADVAARVTGSGHLVVWLATGLSGTPVAQVFGEALS